MKLERIITRENEGRKVKYFVRGDLKIAYKQYCAMKAAGGLRVNGIIVHADYILREGDYLTAEFEERGTDKSVEPECGNVDIIFEDDYLLIINKEAPLACQCTPKQPNGTLENRLAHIFGSNFVFRPLNRLDKGTSGLMCAAKDAHSCQILQSQLHTDRFLRCYEAVVEGILEGSGTVSLPIAKAPEASVRRIIDMQNGKPAVTHWKALYSGNGRTLVRLLLETGRTHQIRVHMASLGHPVCGDFLYGTELDSLPGRFALHSCDIGLDHPITDDRIRFSAPLPTTLESLLKE